MIELTALDAIKCYACNDIPGYEKTSPCSSEHAEGIDCDSVLFDRCVSLTGTLPAPDGDDDKEEEEDDGHGHDEEESTVEVNFKNCTSSVVCNLGTLRDSK